MMKNKKRYQECNWFIKLLRRRFYVAAAFKYLFNFIKPLKVTDDCSGEVSNPKGELLWKLLIGDAQLKMNYYYTSEEVFEKIKK